MIEISEMAPIKKKGQDAQKIGLANKEKYGGILQEKELYITFPTSTQCKVPTDRKLDLLPMKRNDHFQRLDRFSSQASALYFLYVTRDDFRVFSMVRNQKVPI